MQFEREIIEVVRYVVFPRSFLKRVCFVIDPLEMHDDVAASNAKSSDDPVFILTFGVVVGMRT